MNLLRWAPFRFIHWVYRIFRRDKILIDYYVSGDTFRESLMWVPVSMSQAFSMGYIRGYKIKDEIKYAPFKTFVKFHPDSKPGVPTSEIDLQPIKNYETASTLYDHFRSNSIEDFMKGLSTKKQLAPIDQKKLVMIIAIVIGAALGLLMLLR